MPEKRGADTNKAGEKDRRLVPGIYRSEVKSRVEAAFSECEPE